MRHGYMSNGINISITGFLCELKKVVNPKVHIDSKVFLFGGAAQNY